MIPILDSILTIGHKQLITLHMVGSHWWYESRYGDSFRKYKPIANSKHIPSLKKEQIINSYDNTIIYLDYFINNIIEKLKNRIKYEKAA